MWFWVTFATAQPTHRRTHESHSNTNKQIWKGAKRRGEILIRPLTWDADEGHVVSLTTSSQEGDLFLGPPLHLHSSEHLLIMGYEHLLVDGGLGTHFWSRAGEQLANSLSGEDGIHSSWRGEEKSKLNWQKWWTRRASYGTHKSHKLQKKHILSHLPLLVSGHPDSLGFICPCFEIYNSFIQ